MSVTLDAGVLIDTLGPPSGPWKQVDVCGTVSSTNRLSLDRPQPWRLVVAEQQEAGRGRRDRAWTSPAGSSVSMSMSVPLPADAGDWGWMPLVTGLAVRDALTRFGGGAVEVSLKWPNDVLVRAAGSGADPGKVCGILCEVAGDVVVAGVGVNVTVDAADLPVPTATSLHLEGVAVPDGREQVIVAVASAFADRYAEFARDAESIRAAYRGACSTVGQDVTVHVPEGRTVGGRALAVDDDGRLVVEIDGEAIAFAAGDVVHVRREQA